MREYILTRQEQAIINKYLQTGEKLEGFGVLAHRCKKIDLLTADLELIKQFIEKIK